MHINGSCLCGRVTYEADVDPDHVGICHRTDCQKLTGSAYRVTVSAPANRFKITGRSPRKYVKAGDNGHLRLQVFCPDCGSPIYTTGEGEDTGEVGIRLGTVNQRAEITPGYQIWCPSALAWTTSIDKLPERERD